VASQGAPFLTAIPGTIATPARSGIYVDGIPAAQVTPPVSTAQQGPDGQRFWSSEPRAFGSQVNEMMIVSLSSVQYVNYVSLDLPHFPHQASIAWQDEDGNWNWVRGPNGPVLQFIISGSVPAQVNNAAALSAGMNPYHYGAGHWVHFDEMIQPVSCTALLLAGTRALQSVMNISPGQLPRDASGQPAPYPLGCRNLDFGFRALQRSDVPWTPRSPSQPTESQPFASSGDVNGTPVLLTLRENRASDLLLGLPWKCAPQPAASAAVNLYVDSRDPYGNAQVIDRFQVDPTTSGVTLNLYYTTIAPPSGWQAADTPVGGTVITVTGSVPPTPDSAGLSFPDSLSSLSLPCQATGIDFGSPWWHAWEIQPQFAGTDAGTYMICDTGIMQLWYQDTSWLVSMGYGNTVARWPASHQVNDRLHFAAGWDGASFRCWSPEGALLTHIPAASLPQTSRLLFGAPQDGAWGILSGNYRLTSFILKQEPLQEPSSGSVPAQWTAWLQGPPQQYTAPPSGPGPTTMNAAVRFDISQVIGQLSPYGFSGGVDNAWAGASWTPVQLDFQLSAGSIQFPPVTACGFRFEFTDLAAQSYSYMQPAAQVIQVPAVQPAPAPASQPPVASPNVSPYSASQSGANSPLGALSIPPSADIGLAVGQSIAPLNLYSDAPAAPVPPPQGAALPSEVLVGADPQQAGAMTAAGGSLFSFVPWQAPKQPPPAQVTTAPQQYQQVQVTQQASVAFFAGISSITMYKADYTATSDTAEYLDTFGDTSAIDPASLGGPVTAATAPWSWQPGLLSTPANLPPGAVAQVSSPSYYSAHTVTGVQYASVQSGPVQLMPDPAFTDGSLPFTAAIGDAAPLEVSSVTGSPFGSLAIVRRTFSQISWASVMASYPLWSSFSSPQLSWLQVTGNPPATSPYGGIAYTGAPAAVSAAGIIHIAARVFAPATLNAPLYLQLTDGATGVVIAEEPVTVTGGTVTEWYASFIIGQPQASSTLTWAAVQAAFATWGATAGDTWSQIDTYIPPAGNTVSWQIVQYGPTDDEWGVDNVSVFEDSIVWEFSNDGGLTWWAAYGINANPNGALVFPPPAPGRGNQLQWRALGYRPNLTVASLAIRPWYTIAPRGIPPRVSGVPHGPNVSGHDYYTTIDKDPYWQVWSNPVPQDWYYAYQQILQQHTTYMQLPPAPLNEPDIVLGNSLIA
jgi:hypothetical protein